MKRKRKLKNRIISGLIALLIILTPLCTPISVRADENSAPETVTAGVEDVTESETLNDGVAKEDAATPGESALIDESVLSKDNVTEENTAEDAIAENNVEDHIGEEKNISDTNLAGDEKGLTPENGSEKASEKTSEKASEKTPDEILENGDSLHTVTCEKTENAELSVYSSLEESDVEINPITVHAEEEGLEVLEGYEISGKADDVSEEEKASEDKKDTAENTKAGESEKAAEEDVDNEDDSEETEEKLFIKAEVNEEVELTSHETVALYSVENNKAKDVIIEDISLESEPCEIDEDVTGIALVKDTGYRHLNLEIFPEDGVEDKSVVLDGLMPKEATAEVVDVTENEDTETVAEQNAVSENGTEEVPSYITIAAYDITIIDGNKEYQPDEDKPISVTIKDERISADSNLTLWHIKDDGSREEVTDFVVKDGQIIFTATGFSVYEIVNGLINQQDRDLLTKLSENGENGFYTGIYFGSSSTNTMGPFYLKGSQKEIPNQTGRTGIEVTSKITDGTIPSDATKLYFETVSLENNKLSCYLYVMDGTDKKYIEGWTTGRFGGDKPLRSALRFAASDDDKTLFVIDAANGRIRINENGFYWVADDGSNGGTRISSVVGYKSDKDNNLAWLQIINLEPDPYQLDGVTYGLMNKTSGTVGNALMASGDGKRMEMMSVVIRTNGGSKTEYVTDDADITMWTFHSVIDDRYRLSAVVGGEVKYLKATESGLELTSSENEGTQFQVVPGSENTIKLAFGGKMVIFDGTGFTFGTESGNNSNLNFVKKSTVSPTEYITYTASKVSISRVPDGSRVVVYTRVWNKTNKSYDFYAIDRDGSLYPCYERGDNIMWVGTPINTLLWDFTEYHYDDGTPNYYYELQNTYSGKYIAPQIEGQTLSDSKIGINLPGRRDGEYYSSIIAWDEPYYSFAGIRADGSNSQIESCSKADADTFYFAIVDEAVQNLTPVKTIDNNDYGIRMKMVDFSSRPDNGTNEQDDVIGGDTAFNNAKPVQNLLSTDLKSNGYPTSVDTGQSLYQLFKDAKPVNKLFLESTYNASGYFDYDSCQNFASLKGKDSGDFTVYKEIGTMNTRGNNTDKHGQFMPYNDITAGVYSSRNPLNLKDVFGNELPETDPRKYERLYRVGNENNTDATNWNFGMELEADFVQTPSGKDNWGHDIVFQFTGDDDFWFYVDGELIIDLGGVHSALPGNVNFSTGDVYVNGVHKTLRQIFKENFEGRYRAEHSTATDAEVATAVAAYLDQYFDGDETVFKDYSTHTMSIFYMERGKGASNLHMRFNLSYVTPGSVLLSKQVTGTDEIDFSLVQYPFQIWYEDPLGQAGTWKLLESTESNINVVYQNSIHKVDYKSTYSPPNSSVTYNSVYFLYPGKNAEIHFPNNTINYKVVEVGINGEVYDDVYANGVHINGHLDDSTTLHYSFDSGVDEVEKRPNLTFENHVNEDALRTLYIQKQLFDESGSQLSASQDPTTFSYRLYLSNGVDDNLELANMYKYSVMDPEGKICKWNAGTQNFESTNYTEADFVINDGDSDTVKESKRALKKSFLYETSMNGSISKIPAGYTVLVSGLPVGSRFMVEERENEIPVGYKRIGYERESGTYTPAAGDTLNSGWVRANESPKMYVKNKRGFEIQVNKIWSDTKYVSSHDSIFAAVYVKDGDNYTFVDGTLRQIKDPNTSARFFLDSLGSHAFADYAVFEVELTNPVFDEVSGELVSHGGISKRLNDGDLTQISAITKGNSSQETFSYEAKYNQGQPSSSYGSDEIFNVRKDTITNTRTGGIVLTLYDMETNELLPGGVFVLKKGDDVLGTYTADSNGRITILYEFEYDTYYTITQKEAPKAYIGVPNTVTFRVETDNTVTVSGNEARWAKGYKAPGNSDKLIAYIDLFNRPYTFKVLKCDEDTDAPLVGAHFSLYKGVEGLGGMVKDFNPMPGFEDLVSNSEGVIQEINENLVPGTYFLTEIQAPSGYKKFDDDIPFVINGMGNITVDESYGRLFQPANDGTNGNAYKYIISVPNKMEGYTLTITKTVTGSMGNKVKDFTFTLSDVVGVNTNTLITADSDYSWFKNNELQTTKLKKGDTFQMAHGDVVKIVVPEAANVTIAEDSEGYTSEFCLEGETGEAVSSKTITLDANKTLYVTNTLDAVIPTGVSVPVGMLILAGLIAFGGITGTILRQKKIKEEL